MLEVKKKKILMDVVYNIGATFLLTATLQILAFPYLSSKLSDGEFGNILTLIGVSNMLATIVGGALNNVKLINMDSKESYGDFKGLVRKSSSVIFLVMLCANSFFVGDISIGNLAVLLFLPILTMLRTYMNVYYRMSLKYSYIFGHSVVTALGYILGIFIFKITGLWSLVFLIGEIFAYIYAYFTTEYKLERNIKTGEYKKLRKSYLQLASSSLMVNILVYLDRLLINPILGASNVAIYFIASIVGKTLGIVLSPVASIILTYLARFKSINPRKTFIILNSSIFIFGGVVYLMTIPAAPVIVGFLYNESLASAQPYLNIANLSSILMVIGSLIHPIVLKYCPLWWQPVIQSSYMVVYLSLAIMLMTGGGLYGFCLAAAIANGFRIIMLFSAGYYNLFIKES